MDLSFSLDTGVHHEPDVFSFSRNVPLEEAASRPVATIVPAKPASGPALSPLEQTVVALAAFDTRQTIKPPGLVGRLMDVMFGAKPTMKLANERLEALRRYAVLYRHDGDDMSPEERSDFVGAGFGPACEAEVGRLIDTLPTR